MDSNIPAEHWTVAQTSSEISVVVPTYRREAVLVETITHLLGLKPQPNEILVIDQSPEHSVAVQAALDGWANSGAIRYLQPTEPSIPKAMNLGLKEARSEIVLFLDDDIVPDPDLLSAHSRGHKTQGAAVIAGRVIQPWLVDAN